MLTQPYETSLTYPAADSASSHAATTVASAVWRTWYLLIAISLHKRTADHRAQVSEQPAAAVADEGPLVNGLTLDERFQLCRWDGCARLLLWFDTDTIYL
jgi:hypothetical protein